MTTLYRDHPHACGDKALSHNSPTALKGSSPRVWGQVSLARAIPAFFGIIPTRVGTSRRVQAFVIAVWDHPHACGDKIIQSQENPLIQGSSPRVWGQDGFLQNYHKWWRIIPTRVGTRWYTAKRRAAERDHPHACGDKAYDKWLTLRNGGSSPRVWGQERNGDKCDKKQRIIPTRVGTSLSSLTQVQQS